MKNAISFISCLAGIYVFTVQLFGVMVCGILLFVRISMIIMKLLVFVHDSMYFITTIHVQLELNGAPRARLPCRFGDRVMNFRGS